MIGNTLFKHHKRRGYTWTSSLNEDTNYIILVQERFKNCLKNARTYPSEDIDSDHVVIADIRIRLKTVKKRNVIEKFELKS